MPDHVHMLISIPAKYAGSQVIGYINGKSAIHLARVPAVTRRRKYVRSGARRLEPAAIKNLGGKRRTRCTTEHGKTRDIEQIDDAVAFAFGYQAPTKAK